MFFSFICNGQRTWKQPKYTPKSDWMNKFPRAYDGLLSRNKEWTTDTHLTWMNLKIVILSERSQSEEYPPHGFIYSIFQEM